MSGTETATGAGAGPVTGPGTDPKSAQARRVAPPALAALGSRILQAAGALQGEADCVARRLVQADLVGHASHGVLRLRQYVEQIGKGQIRVATRPTTVVDLPGLAVLDAGYCFGQVAAETATRMACDKARLHGVALVAVRHSAHVGRLGDWVELAAEQGCVSFHFVNTLAAPLVAPWGGSQRRLSTNPLAWGMPVAGGEPIVVDMTTSVVAEGKVRLARAAGQSIPPGWVVDRTGASSTDPAALYDGGALLALGGLDAGHKGYALSLMVDLMAGALSGGGSSGPDRPINANNHTVLAISPAAMGAAHGQAVTEEAARFCAWVRSSAAADAQRPVQMPGDVERAQRELHLRDGLWLNAGVQEALREAARLSGLGAAAVDAVLAELAT